MPISISGSGSITGINAGGLPDGCVTGDDIANNAVTLGKLGTTEQGQLCKAWVNFNGTGTVAIRASYNVSSITDNGVGDYTINFTTAMADANYSYTTGGRRASGGGVSAVVTPNGGTITTSALQIITITTSTLALADWEYVNVAIFR